MSCPPTFFVGLIPPPEFAARVLAWQAALGHVITAPHVTLRAPRQEQQATPALLEAFRHTCARTRPFSVTLGGVGTFGERVIFLKVGEAGVGRLHADLVAASGEAPGEFELGAYHPHLTLALSWRAVRVDWADALASARAEFADLEAAPLDFTVREAALFRKTTPGEPYREAARWGFADQRG